MPAPAVAAALPSAYCPAGCSHSSTLLPSGSMTQPNFPNSESSSLSNTLQPSSLRASSRARTSATPSFTMKGAVLGAKESLPAAPMDQTVDPPEGLPCASVHEKAVPPQSCTSMPRCRLYQACNALGALALKKMPPIPVTRFIVLFSLRRLPKLDLVPFRIHHPTEFAELGLLYLVEHLAPLVTKCLQETSKICHAVVDHERGIAWSEARTVADRPRGCPICGNAGGIDPSKGGAPPSLHVDAEMGFVPRAQFGRILCADEHSANSRDAL